MLLAGLLELGELLGELADLLLELVDLVGERLDARLGVGAKRSELAVEVHLLLVGEHGAQRGPPTSRAAPSQDADPQAIEDGHGQVPVATRAHQGPGLSEGVVTSLDGSTTFDSGAIYLEESYALTKPGGGTIDVFRVEVEGSLVGYITSEPLVPGTAYSFIRSNVTPSNAPDTTDPTAIVDVPCFTAGTLIETPTGAKAIEDLAEGDLVLTLDHGPQPIRWVGSRILTSVDLQANPRLRPICVLAGALGAGLPLSATITSAKIEQTCYEKGFLFYTTHAADPLTAAVGLKVIEILQRDALADRARDLGAYLKSQLLDLQGRHSIIGDVRGRGLLIGVELVTDRKSKAPAHEAGAVIAQSCIELGACLNISRRSASGIFRIAPPLTTNRDEIDRAVSILDQALEESA